MDAEREAGDNDDQRENKQKKKYTFPINLIRKWDYNLQNRMGSLLRENKKWDFANREDLRIAYTKIFPDQHNEINKIFRDSNLKWITATRNAIVHRAGIADADFVKLVHDNPTLTQFKEKDSILLDRGLVKSLAQGTMEKAVELLRLMDNWLSKNKE